MLSYFTVEQYTLELLKGLMHEELFMPMRLVGGTSLALQYGHRQSIDLDFFGECDLDSEEVKTVLRRYGCIEVIKETSNIKIYIVNGIKVDFVNYPYRWIDSVIIHNSTLSSFTFYLQPCRLPSPQRLNCSQKKFQRVD